MNMGISFLLLGGILFLLIIVGVMIALLMSANKKDKR